MSGTTCFGLLFIMFCEPTGAKAPPPAQCAVPTRLVFSSKSKTRSSPETGTPSRRSAFVAKGARFALCRATSHDSSFGSPSSPPHSLIQRVEGRDVSRCQ